MRAQDLDAIALLGLFVLTGVVMAVALLMVSCAVAGMLALARGQSLRVGTREWADRLPKCILGVSLVVVATLVSYAVAIGN